MDARSLWAVVLSGGEGARLRHLVRRAVGDDRPKQYAKLLGPRSLLRQTLDRIALGVSVDRTVVVTVRPHTAYIAEEFTGSAHPPYVLVQPVDRGTAAGILYPAHWIGWRNPEATVAIFPSDHFILGEATFMARVLEVARALDRHPDRVALLGAQPTAPDGERGWIEPGPPLDGADGILSSVREFCEAPSGERALTGVATGGLWNTAIVIAKVAALAQLGFDALPEMSGRLARIEPFVDSEEEPAAVHQAYALMSHADFSQDVLERFPESLAVSRLERVTWCDLGDPSGVLDVLARMRVRPVWADLVDQPAAAAGSRPAGVVRRAVAG
jgi:mannose-1-phosphate guanylyltransferase